VGQSEQNSQEVGSLSVEPIRTVLKTVSEVSDRQTDTRQP